MIYNYYPGCTLSTKAKQLDMAARRCAEVLGFPLVELPEWQCCGAVYPMAPDAIAERRRSGDAVQCVLPCHQTCESRYGNKCGDSPKGE